MDSDSQAIYQELRDRICLLKYAPGEMISENALATEFDVSRSRMRRIFWKLEFDGLITISRGSGAVVTTVDIVSLKEVYIVRQKLTELIGEIKPARITAETIKTIEDILAQARQMDDQYDPTKLAKLYNSFHAALLNIIRNSFLRQITDQLYHRTARIWLQLLPELEWDKEVQIMIEEIEQTLTTLRENDMQTLSQLRRNYMSLLLQRINNYLGAANTV